MTVPSVDAIDLPRKLSGDKLSKFREPEAASTFRLRTNSDEIFQPALLAKFVSVPIYNEVGAGPAEREIAAAGGSGEVMTSIDDVDLDTYCGRVGNLYGRYGLCPPFTLRHIAADWKASGIALSHIVAVIDRHLSDHRNRYYSGSGDALFSWVDGIIRKTWREQHFSPPWAQATRPTMQQFPDRDRLDRQPSSEHEVGPRRSPIGREAPVDNRSNAPGRGMTDHAPSQSAKSIGKERRGPKRIDQAIAFLVRELANGEVAAALLEEKAKASGISPRTLDRARARLKVISRRTGFAKDGKCWLSLPRTP